MLICYICPIRNDTSMFVLSIAGQLNSTSTQGRIMQEWPLGSQISRRTKKGSGGMRCHFKNNLISTYGEHKAKILKLLKLENMAILNILTIFFCNFWCFCKLQINRRALLWLNEIIAQRHLAGKHFNPDQTDFKTKGFSAAFASPEQQCVVWVTRVSRLPRS